MEGLTCGADGCASSIYIGDEYNYVYKLTLGVAGAAAAVAVEWDVRSIVGSVQADKGIEALACALPWAPRSCDGSVTCVQLLVFACVFVSSAKRLQRLPIADASSTGLFYAGIQETMQVHALRLSEPANSVSAPLTAAPAAGAATSKYSLYESCQLPKSLGGAGMLSS